MTSRTHSFLLLATAAAASAGGFYGARLTAGGAATPATAPADEIVPVPVVTADVRDADLADTATAYGVAEIAPSDTAAFSVPFDAVPDVVRVSAGQRVAAGAALVDLRPSPEAEAQLRQAEQALAAAGKTAELTRARRDARLATNADVTAAEQAQAAAALQADVVRSRGVGTARTLRAADAGVVTAVAAQPGQPVAAGTPMVVIASERGVRVRLGVDPADTAALAPGVAVTVAVPDSPNTLAGVVERQGVPLNAERLCDVFVRPNGVGGLRPGTFVQGHFVRRTVHGLVVPRSATQLEDDEWCVYAVKDDKAVRHVVTLGPGDERDVLVRGDGLADGDAVVVERDGELSDGVAVRAAAPEEDAK